jgi:biofilm PGA synthesis N-glycosyltransferase PgaC
MELDTSERQIRPLDQAPALAHALPAKPIKEAAEPSKPGFYLPIPAKFAIAISASVLWAALSVWLALPWLRDLEELSNWPFAWFAIGGIAIVPGFMNAFLITSLLLDRRPPHRPLSAYPGLTIIVAAYNEVDSIADTLASIAAQQYPGPLQVLVVDDGSTDGTQAVLAKVSYPWLTRIHQARNAGKAAALNLGLAQAQHALVVTLDGDSYLHGEALMNLVERYVRDPDNTRAVAGSMLVRNSRATWVSRMQEWDYFHGIAAIKRVQSLYHGTLVAQGAFSIYDREVLRQIGGWPDVVGEDILVTWAILKAGWRVGHAEDAMCFTNVPEKLGQLLQQRQRWARGMMEGFRAHGDLLCKARLSTTFIWWNLLFPWLDLAYTLCFMPGIVLALFGIYWIVGPMTLLLLPLSFILNGAMYYVSVGMFKRFDLQVRFNPGGFLLYTFLYSLILQPVSVAGYFTELFGMRKKWGTK